MPHFNTTVFLLIASNGNELMQTSNSKLLSIELEH